MAGEVISEIHARSKTAIVVVGSGLYLKFLTHGPSPLPRGDGKLRAELDARPLEELFAELEKLDPVEAAQVDRHNPRYVSRALEICLLSGEKVSALRDSWAEKTRSIESGLKGVWLIRSRADLHQRIAQRTRQMLSGGAVEEVAALDGVHGNWEKAIGVKEIRRLLADEISREKCEELIVFATRQYAKRQETWFRREKWLEQVRF
jgi:tRNA dimethylallyltransferase